MVVRTVRIYFDFPWYGVYGSARVPKVGILTLEAGGGSVVTNFILQRWVILRRPMDCLATVGDVHTTRLRSVDIV